jgi:hypothetical protein
MVMSAKEKKAFVARMKKGKKNAAKGKSKTKKGGDKTTMKTTTGYIVSSPRYPNGRIFASKDDAIKEYHRQQKYGGAGYSDKTTIRSKNPKYHKRGKYWTP